MTGKIKAAQPSTDNSVEGHEEEDRRAVPMAVKRPKVSFCIPTLNSSRTLRACLESIVSQDYPDLEIIIIDAYSKDETVKIALEYSAVVYYTARSYSHQRQIGIERARGEIAACFDSDVILPDSNWLARAVEQFSSGKKIGAVWPIQVPSPSGSLVQRAYLREQWGIIQRRVEKGIGITGGSNALFTKSCLDEAGGFGLVDIWSFDDFYLAGKLSKLGYGVKLYEVPVIHDTNKSIKEFVRKQRERIRSLKKRGSTGIIGCSKEELLYEYSAFTLVLSLRGIFSDRDYSAILVPILALIRNVLFLLT